jgi:ATPase family protein associated with various cellular activities (AAA)
MARADLLVRLVRSASRGDQTLFRKTLEGLVAEERAKQHHVLADRLEESLRFDGGGVIPRPLVTANGEYVLELRPERDLEDLILPAPVDRAIREVVEEQHRAELLRGQNLEPRHRLLLAGPPGNGKTSLAEALATALLVPMCVVRYEAVVASYLGETSSRLQKLFDYVRVRHCVLFFDEFDTLGKERGDEHETGEIKRVVSTLLLQIDRLPSHVVVVTATNHPELLDRAVWRRFQLRLYLPNPGPRELEEWLGRFERRVGVEFGRSLPFLAGALEGASFGEVEEFALDVMRRQVLAGPTADSRAIIDSRLEQWSTRFQPPPSTRDLAAE